MKDYQPLLILGALALYLVVVSFNGLSAWVTGIAVVGLFLALLWALRASSDEARIARRQRQREKWERRR